MQIVREGNEWKLVGFTDMGPFLNSLDCVINGKEDRKLATHVLQITFNGLGGFRWPVAYFGTNTATAYQLYHVFWKAVDLLGDKGFTVEYCNLDGASTNRAFTNMHFSGDQRDCMYTVKDPFDPDHKIVFIQDIKHVFKKIRNSLYASKLQNRETNKRHLVIQGESVVWDAWEAAEELNRNYILRIHKNLTRDHVTLSTSLKMRNNLAMQVLDTDMLNLMKEYSASVKNSLKNTVELLSHTSKLVEIFSDKNRPIVSKADVRLAEINKCLDFFNEWESEVLLDSEIKITKDDGPRYRGNKRRPEFFSGRFRCFV